jgi:hypothetical protein
MWIWVLRSKLYSFGNISIVSGVIQIDWCNVTCVYSKCRDHSYQLLYFTLDYHTMLNEKSYFISLSDNAVQQRRLKIETWTACVLVCHTVVVERGPFRDVPLKLPYDQDFKFCWAKQETAHLAPHGKRAVAQANPWPLGNQTDRSPMKISSVTGMRQFQPSLLFVHLTTCISNPWSLFETFLLSDFNFK